MCRSRFVVEDIGTDEDRKRGLDDDDESPAFFLHPLPAIVPLIQPSMEEEGVDATAGAAAPQFQAEVSRFRPKWRRLRRKTQDSGVLKPED